MSFEDEEVKTSADVDMIATERETGRVTQAAHWSNLFMEYFWDKFAEAENNETQDFTIVIPEFDDWMRQDGLLDASFDEETSAARRALPLRRQEVRQAINRAAPHGMHGWPSFSIDSGEHGKSYLVRLINSRATSLGREMAKRISCYLDHKAGAWRKEVSFMESEEVKTRFPDAYASFMRSGELISYGLDAINDQAQKLADHMTARHREYHRVRMALERKPKE